VGKPLIQSHWISRVVGNVKNGMQLQNCLRDLQRRDSQKLAQSIGEQCGEKDYDDAESNKMTVPNSYYQN
jgi:hypothetical protein